MKKTYFFFAFLALLFGNTVSRGQSVFSDFSSGDEGWMIVNTQNTYQPEYYSTGGNPDGYICGDNVAIPGTWYFKAPSKFYGDKSGAYDKSFSFDLGIVDTTAQIEDVDVSFTGAGIKLVIDLPHDTMPGAWQHFLLLLNENSGWRIGTLAGAIPTHQNFIDVLTNLTTIGIRGKFVNESGYGCLDNVYLSASSPISTFDTDYEGWRVIGDAQGGFYNFSLTGTLGDQGILQHRFWLSKGKQILKVSLGNVPSGLYIAEMRNGSAVFLAKVVVK